MSIETSFYTNACSLLRGWAFFMIEISQAWFNNPKEAPSTGESLLSPWFQIERFGRDESIANPCPDEEDAVRFLAQATFFMGKFAVGIIGGLNPYV